MSLEVGTARDSGPASAPGWERGTRAPLTGSWWARGLSLPERLGATRPVGVPDGTDLVERTARRRRRWREAHPHVVPDTGRLVAGEFGLTEAELCALLAEPADGLARRVPRPRWAEEVERIIHALPELPPAEDPTDSGWTWQRGFASILDPFVDDALARLTGQPAFTVAASTVDVSGFREAVRGRLRTDLVSAAARVLVLELNVMRVSSRLSGDTPGQRFWSFVDTLRQRAELASLLDEYAVLARTLVTVAGQAADTAAEFLHRFTADRAAIVDRIFHGADPGQLTDVEFAAGDPHDQGRAVTLVRFASGARLVYKPRPMAVHVHVNDVLGWYNDRLPGLDLRRLAVLDRGRYGWVEFVEAEPCADLAAAERYFYRLGAQLALFHALSGVDFHYENVIAAGDQPVPVDLESVLHAGIPYPTGDPFLDGDPARIEHAESVNRVGLLPTIVTGPDGGALDVGAMGADEGVELPYRVVDWADPATDLMRLTRAKRRSPGSRNRPTLGDRPLDPARYTEQLVAGFRAGYRVLAEFRADLVGPDGLLSTFRDDETRVIVRATRLYSALLSESSHPDTARDALDRDLVFALLWASAADEPARRLLARHEHHDLWTANIPVFRTRAGSRDVLTAAGQRIAGLLPESGLARSERVLRRLGPADLRRQEWIIRASMATRDGSGPAPSVPPPPPAGEPDEPVADRALRLARMVADTVERAAARRDGRVGWLGLLAADERWSVYPLALDLFNGYPGLGLFFAQLAAVTGEQRYADLARTVLAPLAGYLGRVLDGRTADLPPTPGLYAGSAGGGYALAMVSVLLGEPALADPVPPLLDHASATVTADRTFDIVGGAAGGLAVAETLVPRFGTTAAVLASRCAQVLVEHAVPAGAGRAWPAPMPATGPLLGFSHGAAGIGWSLLRYSARTGDGTAAEVGYAALAYERAEYRSDLDNWPDFRIWSDAPGAAPGQRPPHMHAWCHGAPGIGLARATLPVRLRTPDTDDDLRRAVDSTAARPPAGNHSLCHGELGNLELFAAAASAGVPGAAELHRRRADAVLRHIEQAGPLCGTPRALPTPGLMTGLAGIGHGLLRLAAPDRVASVLSVEEQR